MSEDAPLAMTSAREKLTEMVPLVKVMVSMPRLCRVSSPEMAPSRMAISACAEQQNAVLLLRLHGERLARVVNDAVERRFDRLGFFFNSNGIGRGLREAAAGLGLGDVKGRSGV